MSWVNRITNQLKPSFGGIPTFCDDPDGLLENPKVREAIRAAGMSIQEWDGDVAALLQWRDVPENEQPVIVTDRADLRVTVQAQLHDYRWESISIGRLFPRFSLDVVREIPVSLWDSMWRLHEETPRMLGTRESALEISRGVFGIDPLFLRTRRIWEGILARIVLANDGLPHLIASALLGLASANGRPEIGLAELSDPIAAKAYIAHLGIKESELESYPVAEKTMIEQTLRIPEERSEMTSPEAVPFTEVPCTEASAEWWLKYGWRFAEGAAGGKLADTMRIQINDAFSDWVLRGQYNLALSSVNPGVLRIESLLEQLHKETTGQRLLVVMVDCLGLVSWLAIEEEWRRRGIIGSVEHRAAFAVIPTLTGLSRRAFFEGVLPSRFSALGHSARMERGLWRKRFGSDGEFFDASETVGIHDALMKGKPRVCLQDTSWDQVVHSLQVDFDSAWEAAKRWGSRTLTANMVRTALAEGYRVIITSDHGHITCVGTGRLQAGELPERSSRRVSLFPQMSLAQSHERQGTIAYQPMGLPKDCFPLFIQNNGSFDVAGSRTESHGGMSLEETIIPVVEVRV